MGVVTGLLEFMNVIIILNYYVFCILPLPYLIYNFLVCWTLSVAENNAIDKNQYKYVLWHVCFTNILLFIFYHIQYKSAKLCNCTIFAAFPTCAGASYTSYKLSSLPFLTLSVLASILHF